MKRSWSVLMAVAYSLLIMPTGVGQTLNAEIVSGHQVVVKLFGAGVGTLDSYGSGVLISEDGHLVTVWNHLVNTGYLTAVVPDGRRFSVNVVGTSVAHDLAVLKLDCDKDDVFTALNWNVEASAAPGQSVLAFSNMFHVATGNEPVSVVHGVIACEAPLDAGLGRWQFPVKAPVYVLDAVTNNSGAAGGLLTNRQGQPVGLIGREIRHRDTGMWVNYAVPWTTLKPAISDLLNGRSVASDVEPDVAPPMISDRQMTAEYGITLVPSVIEKTPAYIDRIIPLSPAATAGLERGDLVLMINNKVIQSTDDVRIALATLRTGQTVQVTVSRDQALQTVPVKVP